VKLTHQPISLKTAQTFITEHHRHNKAPRGHKYSVAAVWDGEIVGVVIVGRTIARKLDDGFTVEVLRCCVRDGAPRNTPSYLYGISRRIWQAWGGKKVITYNLQSESGDSLRGAGFVLSAKTRGTAKGWDRKKRSRANAPIYAEPKNRWEAALAS
jgi:hypothetical protein